MEHLLLECLDLRLEIVDVGLVLRDRPRLSPRCAGAVPRTSACLPQRIQLVFRLAHGHMPQRTRAPAHPMPREARGTRFVRARSVEFILNCFEGVSSPFAPLRRANARAKTSGRDGNGWEPPTIRSRITPLIPRPAGDQWLHVAHPPLEQPAHRRFWTDEPARALEGEGGKLTGHAGTLALGQRTRA